MRLTLRLPATAPAAPTRPPDRTAVGKFGWVTETGGCTLNNITGTTYSVNNSSTSPNCNTPLFDDAQNKSLIYVPVYTSVTGSGSTAVYNLKGIAAFVVTGYNVPGSTFTNYSDWLNSANNCTGTTYCIDGYFVRANFAGSGARGPANLGCTRSSSQAEPAGTRGNMKRRLRLLGRDERGVVGVLIGLLIGTVLLGLGALVIDVGQLYRSVPSCRMAPTRRRSRWPRAASSAPAPR